jgi:hypothetical protein
MIFNHIENQTVDACAPTVFSFVGSEKPGRFPFVKPFLLCKHKAAQLRLPFMATRFPAFVSRKTRSFGVIGDTP